ncbi:unnamed protein product [Menidia menidia]|uniref:(Atlantic silverside) hypothetical protein n=1 Tax=Menidia menidia TaxID=238744 RepID=A0A8S4BFN6_9TELE|nr:unnamed protein product [Menidia menidia]
MLGPRELRSRFFVLICAAVLSFMVCSHAVGAGVVRRLQTPHSQHPPLSRGLPSTDGGPGTLSIPNYQSQPAQHIEGGFSLSNRSNRYPRVKITKLQRGGERPASSPSTGPSIPGGQSLQRWQARNNDQTLPEKAGNPGTSQISYFAVSRNSINTEDVKARGSSKVDDGKSLGKSLYSYNLSPQTSRHWSAPPLERLRGFGEANELPVVDTPAPSSGAQTSRAAGFTGRPGPREAPPGNSLSGSPIRRDPGRERPASSVTGFPQRPNPASSGGTQKVRSYLFKDAPVQPRASTNDGRESISRPGNVSAHWQVPSGAQGHGKISSTFKIFNKMGPNNPDTMAQVVAPKLSYTQLQSSTKPSFYGSARSPSLRPPPGHSRHWKSLTPSPRGLTQDGREPIRGKIAPLDQVNATRELTRDYQPGRFMKGGYRLRGFVNPLLQPLKEPPVLYLPETANSQQSTLNKEPHFSEAHSKVFKSANANQYVSRKYSFGQRRASTTTTRAPAGVGNINSSSPTPANVEVVAPTVSTPTLSTTGFKLIRRLLPESEAPGGRNTTRTRAGLHGGAFDVEGSGTRPLEGAKALTHPPDATAKQPRRGLEGYKLQGLKSWRRNRIRIHRRYNGTAKLSGRSNGSDAAVGPNEANFSQGFQTFTNGTAASKEPNPAMGSGLAPVSHLRSAGRLKGAPRVRGANRKRSRPASERRVLLQTPTSTAVRGRRVRPKLGRGKRPKGPAPPGAHSPPIVRLPTRSERLRAITYADILGSASFISVQAANQRSAPPNDEVRTPNATTPTGEWTLDPEEGSNVTTSPGDHSDQKEDLKRAEGDDDEMTPDFYVDRKGSGGFNQSEVSLSFTGRQAEGTDLSELDYLRISTGDLSFSSTGGSRPGER